MLCALWQKSLPEETCSNTPLPWGPSPEELFDARIAEVVAIYEHDLPHSIDKASGYDLEDSDDDGDASLVETLDATDWAAVFHEVSDDGLALMV